MRLILMDESIQCAFKSLLQVVFFYLPIRRPGQEGFYVISVALLYRRIPVISEFCLKTKFTKKEIRMMRTKYLVRSDKGNHELVRVSGKKWYQIAKESKLLPKEQRRYFIRDVIPYDGDYDILYVEVSEDEYREWKHEERIAYRNREQSKNFSFCSLEAELEDEEELYVSNTACTIPGAEDMFFEKNILNALLDALDNWKPWARELLLQWYIKGARRSSTKWLARYCGVTEETARQYRKKFDAFVRNFLKEYSE